MGDQRRFSVKFGGVGNSQYHDGKISVKYFNTFSEYDIDTYALGGWSGGKVESYEDIFANYLNNTNTSTCSPIIHNYTESEKYGAQPYQGVAAVGQSSSQNYSIFRREYEVYDRPGAKIHGYYDGSAFYEDSDYTKVIIPRSGLIYIDDNTEYYYQFNIDLQKYSLIERAKIYKSEWEPVIIKTNLTSFYDYNITNGKSYQYIIYPDDILVDSDDASIEDTTQSFANSGKDYLVWKEDPNYRNQGRLIQGSSETSNTLGSPVVINWDEWSICELLPVKNVEDAPVIKNAYKVNTEQVWRFKFSLETGNQTQTLGRSEFQTLGQYPKVGFGKLNYAAGEVSALLGSEIVLGTKSKYIERLNKSRLSPLSTNEKVAMLQKWKEFVGSKNPKLLKDIKGQSWIVQIMSGNSSSKNFYLDQPETISFQWKQVEDTKNVIIYSEVNLLPKEKEELGSALWEPIFKNKKF